MNQLTADCGRVEERLHNFWVHLDCQVLLLYDALIPLLDALLHPGGELVLEGRVQDCRNPDLWELVPLLINW